MSVIREKRTIELCNLDYLVIHKECHRVDDGEDDDSIYDVFFFIYTLTCLFSDPQFNVTLEEFDVETEYLFGPALNDTFLLQVMALQNHITSVCL